MQAAYIALGSNISCPKSQIQMALEYLSKHPKMTLIKQASLYTNPPVGLISQPDFVNTLALIETTQSPQELLKSLLAIETVMGRQRVIRWGPRVIDLDIVLYGDVEVADVDLMIPHPRMKERDFVLWPLFEIAPTLILPDGTPLCDLISKQPNTLVKLEKEEVAS